MRWPHSVKRRASTRSLARSHTWRVTTFTAIALFVHCDRTGQRPQICALDLYSR
ncbi:hypothetical protein DM75_3678 [Burkholderia mallei]|nr:hypothetical protein DM75_3678 [Burkholderia mallei]